MLGRDHGELGTGLVDGSADGRTAWAISAGASTSVAARKAPGAPVNEDGLLVVDADEALLLAVADGHHGHEASHRLLEGIADRARSTTPWPRTSPGLARWIATACAGGPPTPSSAASTLLVVVLDRGTGQLRGLSFGDSQAWVVPPRGRPRPLHPRTTAYVDPAAPESLAAARAAPILADLPQGGWLVLQTDGVHECCYGRPERSVGPRELETLAAEAGGSARTLAADLLTLALRGVGGLPGGEDNVALIVHR